MARTKIARRDWLKQTAGLAVGTAVGSVTAEGSTSRDSASIQHLASPQTPSFSSEMGYRRLGRTELIVSEIGLGGHYFYKGEEFTTQEKRNEVVAAALESGINFFETTDTPGEDETTGEALRVLGARDRVYITHDFAAIRKGEWDRAKALRRSMEWIETGLRNFHTDHIDIWRPPALQTGGTPLDLIEWVVEAGLKAKEQGKIRYMGISSHSAKWLIEALHRFDQFDLVIIPYNYLFRQAEKELFRLIKEKDLGMMTIKPFLAESLFKKEVPSWAEQHDQESTQFEGEYKEKTVGSGTDRLAVNALRFILSRPEVTVVAPGMSTVHEVKTNVKAAHSKELASVEDAALKAAYSSAALRLPNHLSWMHSWA